MISPLVAMTRDYPTVMPCAVRLFDCLMVCSLYRAGRCMCHPRWAHKGVDCDELRWNSWALMVILTSVSVESVAVLVSAAKKLSKKSSNYCSGFPAIVNLFLRTNGEREERAPLSGFCSQFPGLLKLEMHGGRCYKT